MTTPIGSAPGEPALGREVKGKHVLFATLAFFACVFAANGIMMYYAISTYSGLDANEPYRKGLDYNHRIEADEAQAKLGWVATLAADKARTVTLSIADKTGSPVSGLVLTAQLARPATTIKDAAVHFTEVGAGRYSVKLAETPAGTWRLDVSARKYGLPESDPIFRVRRRLWLEP